MNKKSTWVVGQPEDNYVSNIKKMLPPELWEKHWLNKADEPLMDPVLTNLHRAVETESFRTEEVRGCESPHWVPILSVFALVEIAYYMGRGELEKVKEIERRIKKGYK